MKVIIKCCNEENIEAYIIPIYFNKAYDKIGRETLEVTMKEMNFWENLIEMVKLPYKQT